MFTLLGFLKQNSSCLTEHALLPQIEILDLINMISIFLLETEQSFCSVEVESLAGVRNLFVASIPLLGILNNTAL